jgi:hypothetical protein
MTRPNPIILLALAKKKGKPQPPVAPTDVASVTVAPTDIYVPEGATQQLAATVRNANGVELTGRVVTWASGSPANATVSDTGLVTGVSAATVVTITATCEGVSGAASVIVTDSPEPTGEFVTFSNAAHELILGPLTVMGDGLLDGTSTTTNRSPWPFYDANILSEIGWQYDRYPKFWPRMIEGTVQVTNGSTQVVGTGTVFTNRVQPYTEMTAVGLQFGFGIVVIKDGAGTQRPVRVQSVQDDTHLTLELPWAYTSAPATTFSTSTRVDGVTYGATSNTAALVDTWMYYDAIKVAYIHYYRTGNADDLRVARKLADCWWQHPLWLEGTYPSPQDSGAPRTQPIEGLMLRALDGRPEMWGPILQFIKHHWNSWVYSRRANTNLHYGVRDPAYASMYMIDAVLTLPNGTYTQPNGVVEDGATFRSTYLEQIKACFGAGSDGAPTDYWCRLQWPDGTWRDENNDFWADQYAGYFQQPFLVALLMEALIQADRLFAARSVAASYSSNVRRALVKGALNLYTASYRRHEPVLATGSDALDATGVKWRNCLYFQPCDGMIHPYAQGTCTLTPGSAVVTGSGTKFTDEFASPYGSHSQLAFVSYGDNFMALEVLATDLTTDGTQVITGPPGTLFTQWFAPGDMVGVKLGPGIEYDPFVVVSIESDTAMTLGNTMIAKAGVVTIGRLHTDCLKGGVKLTNGSDLVEGLGTAFTTQLTVGQRLWFCTTQNNLAESYRHVWLPPTWVGAVITVAEITDDTHMRISAAWTWPSEQWIPYAKLRGGAYQTHSIESDTQLTLEKAFVDRWGRTGAITGLVVTRQMQAHPHRTTDPFAIESKRQYNPEIVHSGYFARRLVQTDASWAAYATADRWLELADEMMSATYGKGVGPGADSQCSRLYHTTSETSSKLFNQNYRHSGRALAWRLGAPLHP